MLSTRGLAVGYGSKVVVDGVSLALEEAQICTLIGPNGAGKSTILKTLVLQLVPLGGVVLLGEQDLRSIDAGQLARTMAILTTERVNPELMTCEDVVAMGRYPHTGRLGLLGSADRAAIADAMELAGIASLAEQPFACVSDGQRQRVMLARAICQEPRVLVLDEPTSYLDIRHKLGLLRILRELAHERGVAVVMTLHELELARYVSDLVVCVANGHVDRVGSPREVFCGGYIRRLYDVRDDKFEEVYPHLDAPEPESDSKTGPGAAAIEEPYVRSGQKQLRRGITTGTCAALATAAATTLLLSGHAPSTVGLVTPKGLAVEVEPVRQELAEDRATCAVRKDAGDDPDVTDGVLVVATVERTTTAGVSVHGGEGVGRVTRPGLDQPPGAAAINRVPRQMIEEQAIAAADELGYEGGLAVTISIPGGEVLAQRTFNEQLGVVGGLSILGTSGIEEPMSEQALVSTIELALQQARAQGAVDVLLLPGNYAEDFVRATLPELSDIPQVKYSNYLGDALDVAVNQGFANVLVVGHIGKLVKLAGGIMNTHSKVADCRLELMCAHAATCGASTELCAQLMEAVTTDAALDLLCDAGYMEQVMERLLEAMQRHLSRRAGGALRAGAMVFSNQRGPLGTTAVGSEVLRTWRVGAEDEPGTAGDPYTASDLGTEGEQ